MYATKQNAQKGIESVQHNASTTEINDLT
ncbi:DUF1508 domain-containing protein [Photobacterium sagamiensis]